MGIWPPSKFFAHSSLFSIQPFRLRFGTSADVGWEQTLKGHMGAVFAGDLDESGSLAVTGSSDRVNLPSHFLCKTCSQSLVPGPFPWGGGGEGGGRGVPQSGLRSGEREMGYSNQVLGQGYLLPPSILDSTRHGQDMPRAVRLLWSRGRTFLLYIISKCIEVHETKSSETSKLQSNSKPCRRLQWCSLYW